MSSMQVEVATIFVGARSNEYYRMPNHALAVDGVVALTAYYPPSGGTVAVIRPWDGRLPPNLTWEKMVLDVRSSTGAAREHAFRTCMAAQTQERRRGRDFDLTEIGVDGDWLDVAKRRTSHQRWVRSGKNVFEGLWTDAGRFGLWVRFVPLAGEEFV